MHINKIIILHIPVRVITADKKYISFKIQTRRISYLSLVLDYNTFLENFHGLKVVWTESIRYNS